MKSYKEYDKQYIGSSDIAALILVGITKEEGVVSVVLHFGGDDAYSAYIVDEEAEIGNHYHKVAEFETWLKIYDDAGLVDTFEAPRIAVYRSAERGCIIHISQIGERSSL